MRPLLWPGERVAVRPGAEGVGAGDVVVVLRAGPQGPALVAHRLVRVVGEGADRRAVCRGDALPAEDEPVELHALIGRVEAVWRDGAWRDMSGARARAAGRAAAELFPALARAGAALNAGVEALARALWRLDPEGRGALSPLSAALAVVCARETAAALASSAARRAAAAAAGGRPRADLPAPGAEQPVLGELRGETVWSGEVRVAGDVYVPPGSVLRVAAGASVRFDDKPGWLCPHERPGWSGWAAVTDSDFCSLIVAGRLIVEGREGAAARLGAGTAWGGVHFVGRSSGSALSGAEITGSRYAGVSLWDHARARLERCRLSGNRAGVAAHGASRARLDDCRLEEHAEDAVSAGARAACELRGVAIRGAGVGVRAAGGRGRVVADGVSISDCQRQSVLAVGGRAVVRGANIEGSGAQAMRAEAGGRIEASCLRVRRATVGVSVDSSDCSLASTEITDCARAGAEVDGEAARLALDRARFERCAVGLRVSGGAVTGRGGAIRNCPSGVEVRAGSLAWTGAQFSAAEAAVQGDGGSWELRSSTLTDCRYGAVVRGGLARLAGVRAECSGAALSVSGGRARWIGGRAGGGDAGARVEGGGASLDGVEVAAGRGPALELVGGRLEVGGGAISAAAGAGLLLSGGEAHLSALRLDDCAAGAVVRAGRAVFTRVLVAPRAGAALAASGGEVDWNGGTARGAQAGVLVEGGRVVLRAVEASAASGHAWQLRGGELIVEGGGAAAPGGAGLMIEGGRARVAGARLAPCRFGIVARGGSARVESASVDGGAQSALSLEGGEHELLGWTWTGGPRRILVGPDACVRWGDRGGPWSAGAAGGAAARLKSALIAAVVATRDFFPFDGVYRAVYALPARLLGRWCAQAGWVAWAAAHRSWAAGDWAAGGSDVDFVLSARGLSGPEGAAREAEVWDGLRRCKRLLPITGEVLLAEPGDWELYARDGGLRAAQLSAAKTVYGGPPEGLGLCAPAPTAAFAESAHAYTRLMLSALWDESSSSAARREAVLKSGLDLIRYDGENPFARPRRRVREELAGLPGDLAAAARRVASARAENLRAAALDLAAAALSRLDARARALLDQVASGPGLEIAPGEGEAAPQAARRAAEGWARLVRRELGDGAAGACDGLYRSTIVVEDAAAEFGRARAALEAVARWRRERGWPITLPLVMTRSTYRLWSALAYLECPTRWLDGRGPGVSVRAAGGGLSGYAQFCWGLDDLEAPPAALVRASAREAAAAFAVGRRFTASPLSGLSADYAEHYTRSRRLGLRLLVERGVAAPFFDLDALERVYRREFGDKA